MTTPTDHPAPLLIRITGWTSAAVAVTALLGIAGLMLTETALRHLFGEPLGWNVSVVDSLMKVVVFGGLAYSVLNRAHVATDLVFRRLPRRMRSLLALVSHCLVLLVAVLLTGASAMTVYEAWAHGDIVPAGGFDPVIPTWLLEVSVPLGSLLLVVVAVHNLRTFLAAPEQDLVAQDDHVSEVRA